MSIDAPLRLDLSDFDAVGIASDAIATVRAHAIANVVATSAEVSAPDGWHRVVINCSDSGNVNLRVRFVDLTTSRANNVSTALLDRGWQLDEDRDGASSRYLPGVEATSIAFDVLAVLSLGGAPTDVRSITATEVGGRSIELRAEG